MHESNELNLGRGLMMGLMGTLSTHPELDPVMTMLAVRGMLDDQLEIMLAQLTEGDKEQGNE